MKEISSEFKTQLYDAVKNIESVSSVEAVAIIKKKSGDNSLMSLILAIFVGAIAYILGLRGNLAFVLSLALLLICHFYPRFYMPIYGQKTLRHFAEVYARATFQKGNMCNTKDRTAFLIYCSYIEKQTVLIFDQGILDNVPKQELSKMENDFQNIWKAKDFKEELINQMNKSKEVFGAFLPIKPDDINELPDDLDVQL